MRLPRRDELVGDADMELLTPDAEPDAAARDEKVHVVGLSILSGSHVPLVRDVLERLRAEKLDVPVVVGGIIPPEDEALLKKSGVAAVFTPKDYELNRILGDLLRIVETAAGKNAA